MRVRKNKKEHKKRNNQFGARRFSRHKAKPPPENSLAFYTTGDKCNIRVRCAQVENIFFVLR